MEEWRVEIIGILSMDMSKAFDTMHPTLLLARLQAYGFFNESLTLMRSFFMDRKERAKLGAVVSDWKPINVGCPQVPTWDRYYGISTKMISFTWTVHLVCRCLPTTTNSVIHTLTLMPLRRGLSTK